MKSAAFIQNAGGQAGRMLSGTADLFCFTLLCAGNMNVAVAVRHGVREPAMLRSGESFNGMRGKSKGAGWTQNLFI